MDLATLWTSSFGPLLPVGDVLRNELTSTRWLRIHSLPESKRYPDSEVEYEELLRRHNAVASEVLGLETRCWLILARYASASDTIDWKREAESLGYELEETSIWGRPLCDDDCLYTFGVSRIVWKAGHLDKLIRSVADDRERFILFSEVTGDVYAPYDGGADLFVRSRDRRDALRRAWKQWRSSRDDGL
jgi:hypothetical protein